MAVALVLPLVPRNLRGMLDQHDLYVLERINNSLNALEI